MQKASVSRGENEFSSGGTELFSLNGKKELCCALRRLKGRVGGQEGILLKSCGGGGVYTQEGVSKGGDKSESGQSRTNRRRTERGGELGERGKT